MTMYISNILAVRFDIKKNYEYPGNLLVHEWTLDLKLRRDAYDVMM